MINLKRRLTQNVSINEVQLYPILYDISDKFYYDSVRKENAWTDISENIKEPSKYIITLIIFNIIKLIKSKIFF